MADDRIEIELIIDEAGPVKSVERITAKSVDSAQAIGQAFTVELAAAFNDINRLAARSADRFRQEFILNSNLAFRSIIASAATAAASIRASLSGALSGGFNATGLSSSIGRLTRGFSVIPAALTGAFAGAGLTAIAGVTNAVTSQVGSVEKLNAEYIESGDVIRGVVTPLNLLENSFEDVIRIGKEFKQGLIGSREEVLRLGSAASEAIEVQYKANTDRLFKSFGAVKKRVKDLASNVRRTLRRAFSDGFDPKRLLRGLNSLRKSIFNFRNAFIGGIATIGVAALLTQVTRLSSAQQDAVNALNTSLGTAGAFSKEASQSFQDLARQLQRNSTFGDELILQQSALARNYGRTNEETKKLITASIDLSAATGISLDSAIRNLGKTLSGLQGELGEAVPQVRALTQAQLEAGEAINVVAQRFAGAALGQIRTFSGALSQLTNNFGDFLESIGDAITQSPAIIALFNSLSNFFSGLGGDLRGTSAGFEEFIRGVILGVIAAADITVDAFETILKLPNQIARAFVALQITFVESVNGLLIALQPLAGVLEQVGLGEIGESADNIAKNTALVEGLSRSLVDLSSESLTADRSFDDLRERLDAFSTDYFQTLGKLDQNGIGQAITNSTQIAVDQVPKDIAELQRAIALLRVDAIEAIGTSFYNEDDAFDSSKGLFKTLGDQSKAELLSIQEGLQGLVQSSMQAVEQLNQAFKNGVVNAISGGVQSAVQALLTGENAFEAFGQAVLGVFGDLAIQLGQFFIAQGIAVEFLNAVSGTGAIAAGIGLVALGTLMKSFSGGGGAAAAGAGSSITPPLSNLDPGGTSDQLRDPSAAVNVTIQGDVFDSDATGLRIANILNEQGFENAVIS